MNVEHMKVSHMKVVSQHPAPEVRPEQTAPLAVEETMTEPLGEIPAYDSALACEPGTEPKRRGRPARKQGK